MTDQSQSSFDHAQQSWDNMTDDRHRRLLEVEPDDEIEGDDENDEQQEQK